MRTEPWAQESTIDDDDDFAVESDEEGFALRLSFAPNELLASEELVLYCHGGGEVVDATPPVWKDPQHDPTRSWRLKKVKKRGAEASQKKLVARPTESFFRIFDVLGANDDDRASDDALYPLPELQTELILRLREDAIPRAAMYYINALHGFEDGDLDGVDEEELFGAEPMDEDHWEDARRAGKGRTRH